MNIEYTHIGSIPAGDGGWDDYYKIVPDYEGISQDGAPTFEDISYEEVLDRFRAETYDEGRGPGQSFCHAVTLMSHPYNDYYVGIVHVRLDI